ncbi:hypothetical protein DFH09DRAFT_1152865, partial [Mycena vulgaris]
GAGAGGRPVKRDTRTRGSHELRCRLRLNIRERAWQPRVGHLRRRESRCTPSPSRGPAPTLSYIPRYPCIRTEAEERIRARRRGREKARYSATATRYRVPGVRAIEDEGSAEEKERRGGGQDIHDSVGVSGRLDWIGRTAEKWMGDGAGAMLGVEG